MKNVNSLRLCVITMITVIVVFFGVIPYQLIKEKKINKALTERVKALENSVENYDKRLAQCVNELTVWEAHNWSKNLEYKYIYH